LSPPFWIGLAVLALSAFWLARWLGNLSLLIAGCLWVIAGLGVGHAAGRLPWLARQRTVGSFFRVYAPRLVAADIHGSIFGSRPPHGSSAEARPTIPDVSRLVGLDDVRGDIDQLVRNPDAFKNTVSPATVIMFCGPHGTGKTSLALRMAADLHAAGIVSTDLIVPLSPGAIPGLNDSYGLSQETLSTLTRHVEEACDGVLLIDDIDRLLSTTEQAVQEVGSRILQIARRSPGRLLVICTGSDGAYARLDPGRRWLGRLKEVRIQFSDLPDDALKQIFLNLLASRRFQLAADAETALRIRLREIRGEHGDEFDNAYAVQRLVDAVLHNQALRLRQASLQNSAQQMVIAAEDVRHAVAPA
jgi:hypothetical protein